MVISVALPKRGQAGIVLETDAMIMGPHDAQAVKGEPEGSATQLGSNEMAETPAPPPNRDTFEYIKITGPGVDALEARKDGKYPPMNITIGRTKK